MSLSKEGEGFDRSSYNGLEMAQRDILRPLFVQRPLLVAGVVLVAGWGSLLLIAWRAEAVTSTLLTSPGFMIGDLILLPLAGGLIAGCYRQAKMSMSSNSARKLAYVAFALASLSALSATLYSLLISGNYHGSWSVPHTLFIWFIAYVLIHFILKGAFLLYHRTGPRLYYRYTAVIAAVSGHILLKLLIDSASFEVA